MVDKRVVGTGLAAVLLGILLFIIVGTLQGCRADTSDDTQRKEQEKILAQATEQVGMPAITNFRERKLVKMLFELRDQDGLSTWSYIYSPQLGKFTYLGPSIGYGIPAATQFTNPEKIAWSSGGAGYVLPQADPNGLFSPSSADASWVFLIDPVTGKASPQYVEDKIDTFTYMLPERLVIDGYPVEKK